MNNLKRILPSTLMLLINAMLNKLKPVSQNKLQRCNKCIRTAKRKMKDLLALILALNTQILILLKKDAKV